jgi:hypothetical protein
MKLQREKYSANFILYIYRNYSKDVKETGKINPDANSQPLPPRPGVLTTQCAPLMRTMRKHIVGVQFSRRKPVSYKVHYNLAKNASFELSGKLSEVCDIHTLNSNIT